MNGLALRGLLCFLALCFLLTGCGKGEIDGLTDLTGGTVETPDNDPTPVIGPLPSFSALVASQWRLVETNDTTLEDDHVHILRLQGNYYGMLLSETGGILATASWSRASDDTLLMMLTVAGGGLPYQISFEGSTVDGNLKLLDPSDGIYYVYSPEEPAF